MDDNSGAPDGDPLDAPHRVDLPNVVEIVQTGDIILDLIFENSRPTIKSDRKHLLRTGPGQTVQAAPKLRSRVGFRVDLEILKSHSKYFEKLLSDSRFNEAKAVATAFSALTHRGIKPAAADPTDLPWVKIVDDDEATRLAHREAAFAGMLRLIHGQPALAEPVTFDYVTTLAVLADRFDCLAAVSKAVASGLKFKWPVIQRKAGPGEDARMPQSVENALRQKILVSWLLNQPVKFQAATRELITNGSCRWAAFPEADEGAHDATWWDLQDGLEQELQFRRECILSTIASVPRHFISLYTSRTRQCKLGYDSSAACDSYQLGEMLKFLTNKSLFFLVDFSPRSWDTIADTSLLQVDTVLATLRQCPGYQIDKNHTNCGLRTRMLPILDFIAALLSANSVPITRIQWRNNRQSTAWFRPEGGDGKQDVSQPFQFTRSMAGDQRLRFEHALGAEKFAKDVFTASSWNWTSETY